MTTLNKALEELMIETGKAHHQAFLSTDGEDPDWAIWYSAYLKPKLEELLSQSFTENEITFWLVGAERAQKSERSEEPWSRYYAQYLLDQLHIE